MNVPAVLKNRKVQIGAGVAGAGLLAIMFLRRRAANKEADNGGADDGSFDTTYWSLPPVQVSTDTSNTAVSPASLLDYAKSQSQLTANMNYAAIAAATFDNFLTAAKAPVGSAGLLGTFNIGGTPINFDFTFKDKKAVITSPPPNTVPATTTSKPPVKVR